MSLNPNTRSILYRAAMLLSDDAAILMAEKFDPAKGWDSPENKAAYEARNAMAAALRDLAGS